MAEPFDEPAVAGHEAAGSAQGLGERAHADVDSVVAAGFLDQTAAPLTEHTRRVGLVNHQNRGLPSGEVAEVGQGRDRAVH